MATVSNVFNRPQIVAPATRGRVEVAIVHLGYVRNESARQLRIGQSRTIGLIVPDIANPFFTDVARGVEDATSAVGALVIVCNSDDDPVKEAGYLTLFAEQHVQGALIVPVRGPDSSVLLVERGIPVVLLDSRAPAADQCSVSVNDVAGGAMAVTHLLESGHRTIGFLGADSEAPQVRDRWSGASEAVGSTTQGRRRLTPLAAGSLTVAGGTAAARQLLDIPKRSRPTAVACANDLLALGLLYELLRKGVRVPEEVAIVGYDDITFAESATVPLTSVRQPRQQLGRRAAELLIEESAGRNDGSHVHTHQVFEPELVVRRSSDPRPSGRPPVEQRGDPTGSGRLRRRSD